VTRLRDFDQTRANASVQRDARSPLEARATTLEALGAERFDVLVIGGGITGAGVARDAAMRGLRVALVERDDFASGTSSRSSRLIHGGVRYLEHGHLHLVFEACRERATLLRIAPHLVRPLAFTWPVYAGARVPFWKLEAGLTLYDTLSLFRTVALHRPLGASGVRAAEPQLSASGLRGGARYWDARTDDARLTLATARSAERAGAVVANHVAAESLLRDASGRVRGAVLRDGILGATIECEARVVVNATGPWSDALTRLADPGAPAAVLGSKGVHVLVPRERVGNVGAVTLLSPLDGRVMFVLPSDAHAIIGTTETPAEQGPDDVRASQSDVDYLLASANLFFPDARLTTADVLSAWAGLRPLAAPLGDGNLGSASREHSIVREPSGLVTVTGGKLTTYRSMAADVVDRVQRELGVTVTHAGTDVEPLPGGSLNARALDTERDRAVAATGDESVAHRLVGAHGDRWHDVWSLAEQRAELGERIAAPLPYLAAEIVYAVQREMAWTIGDLLIRRTHVAFETRDNGLAASRVVSELAGAALGWSDAERARQLAAYATEVRRIFAVEMPDR
jgi:glycerol-3-phosphate dehydrogenase